MSSAILDPAAAFSYSERVHELFADLRQAGALPAAECTTVAVGHADKGAAVTWFVRADDATLQTVRYRAYGCPHFLAGCELLARWLEGKPVAALNDWNWRDLEAELHAPPSKRSHWLLLEDAARQMAKKLIE